MKILLHNSLLSVILIFLITAININELYAQSCTCPVGAVELTSSTPSNSIVAGNNYCVSSGNSVTISGAIFISGNNTGICIEEGAFLEVTGALTMQGTNNIITVSDGAGMTVGGSITMQSGTNAIRLNDCSILEVCGTTTLNTSSAFGWSNTIDYVGDGAATNRPTGCSSYSIHRGSVSGSENPGQPNIADELTTIFMAAISLTNVQIDCGPNTSASGPNPPVSCINNGTWPDGLTNSASAAACGEAEDILNNTLLDVELVIFSAVKENKTILLNWETASESNNLGFEIERSKDTKDWSKIGFVEGEGTTIQYTYYKWQDVLPLNDLNYYRLKQLDTDGAYSYSSVISIKGDEALDMKIYPTVANEVLSIDYPKDIRLGSLKIIDLTGKTVWSTKNSIPATIDVSNLRRGMHFLLISTTQGQKYHKYFIKS